MIPWEKNPAYPQSMGNCKACQQWGPVKLAWDLRGTLCLDAKSCLARSSQSRRYDQIKEEVRSEFADIDYSLEQVVETKKKVRPNPNKVQILVCEVCEQTWERMSQRGRLPKVCNDCK